MWFDEKIQRFGHLDHRPVADATCNSSMRPATRGIRHINRNAKYHHSLLQRPTIVPNAGHLAQFEVDDIPIERVGFTVSATPQVAASC